MALRKTWPDWNKWSLNSYDIGKVIYSVCTYKWNIDCRNAHECIYPREWIAIGLIIRLYQCKFHAVCTVLKTAREWTSNKRSKLFFNDEFKMCVSNQACNQGGVQTGNQSLPQNFVHYFRFKKNVTLINVSCETPEQITDYLYFKLRSLFLHGSVYSGL